MNTYSKRQLQIVDTAVDLIAEGGIQQLTMKNLSVRIGISEPAIYRHFENKTAILEAIQARFKEEKHALFSEIRACDMAAIEKIMKVIESHFSSFSKKPATAAVIFSEDIFQNEQRIAKMVAGIMELSRNALLQIVSEGQSNKTIRSDIPSEHLVTLIMGSLRLIVKKWNFSNHAFDLVAEGKSFSESVKKILEPGK
jgi:AcrR family transcriptional regulator